MKILICDDKPEQAEKTEQKIISRGIVKSLAGAKLKDALTDFLSTVSTILDGNLSQVDDSADSFDEFDVLIVDNNLTDLQLDGARMTAETIIGYLRAFADTPYIISLNKNPHVDFDLRYLFGDYQSLSDLALNTRHLTNHRLWVGKSEGDFAPWYWPRIEDAAARRRKQNVFVEENFESPVWEALNFPSEADDYLSLRAKSHLSSAEKSERETSFEVFLDTSRAVPPADIKQLKKLASNGNESARKAIHRISAYEVDRWLRRDVLGTQDVLIDLPHLLSQMPFLLGNDAHRLDCWNAVLGSDESPFGLDARLFEDHLITARFDHEMWVPGPCFWWPKLKSDDALSEKFFNAKGDWPDAVFCEDVSRFVCVNDGEDSPQEFESEIEGSWTRRYIAYVDDYLYSPRSRILGSAT